MNENTIKEFEARLLEMRNKLVKELGYFSKDIFKETLVNSSGDISAYHSHMADQGTDAMEREKAFMFMSNEGKVLKSVNDALRKIVRKTYGFCEVCNNPINEERLKAIPYARLCIKCKQAEEDRSRRPKNAYL